MDINDELVKISRSLGHIEGQLVEISKLSERVALLEQWQYWLKGGWAFLVAGYAYIFKTTYGK